VDWVVVVCSIQLEIDQELTLGCADISIILCTHAELPSLLPYPRVNDRP
jgi:hypothetical protein